MNQWTVMAPHARLVFQAEEGQEAYLHAFHDFVQKISGVKLKKGMFHVPFNALRVVNEHMGRYPGVSVAAAAWLKEPSEKISWEEIEAELREKGEIRDWVLDGFLTDYQKDAITFGWNLEGVHFWHTTGSGKTLSGIVTALSTEGPVVVVTRAASRIQYAREIERFLNVRAYVVRPESQLQSQITVQGETWNQFRSRHKGQGLSTKKMGKLWKEHQDKLGIDPPKTIKDYLREIEHRAFVVVGWEALTANLDLLTRLSPGAVIYDESHRGKGNKRYEVVHLPDLPDDEEEAIERLREETRDARSKKGFIKDTDDGRKMFVPVMNTAAAAATLARASGKRICTTATPVSDRVRDLWAQLDLSEPNAWGNATAFFDRYCDRKPGTYGGFDTTGSSNLEELNERIKGIAHILTSEQTHAELPPKRRQSVYIAPEDQCRSSAGFAKEIREARRRSGAMGVIEAKLAESASRKRKAVLDMITDHVNSKHKVVVFTGRKRDCDLLGDDVRKKLKKTNATIWVAHGEQSTTRRQEIIDEYMAHPGPCVLVGTGHAFGESLNIHDTDAAFFVMLPYTPGQLRQWEGRFSRLGMKRPVVIYYVIAEGTVDEHIASILIDKLPAVEKIAKDSELASAQSVLAGIDENESDEDFVNSILSDLDFD